RCPRRLDWLHVFGGPRMRSLCGRRPRDLRCRGPGRSRAPAGGQGAAFCMISFKTPRTSHPINAVLFDWGETLVLVPNMVNTIERHIACLEQLYWEPRTDGGVVLRDFEVPWPRFREAYAEASCKQIRRSHETRREHRFEDRFLNALELAGVTQVPSDFELAHLVDQFENYIVREARIIDGVMQVIPELAKHARLGVVYNYPSHR